MFYYRAFLCHMKSSAMEEGWAGGGGGGGGVLVDEGDFKQSHDGSETKLALYPWVPLATKGSAQSFIEQ